MMALDHRHLSGEGCCHAASAQNGGDELLVGDVLEGGVEDAVKRHDLRSDLCPAQFP